MSQEIIEKIDQIAMGIKAAQEICEKNSNRLDALDQIKFDKIVDESSKMAEQLQQLEQKAKGAEEAAKSLEESVKIVLRNSADGKIELNEVDKKASNEFSRYLRKGIALSAETVEQICNDIAQKSFYGAEDGQLDFYKKSLISGVNPDGGYWVRPQLSARVVERLFETSPVRLVASVETTTSDTLEMIIDDNEADSGGWVGETEDREETGTPKIGLLSIPVHEQYAQPKATQKMLDNSGFNIEQWLSKKVTDKFTRVENTAFVVGDGSKKPKGFLSYQPWSVAGVYERDKIEQVNSGDATTITADGLARLQNSLIEDYQSQAVFMLKRITWSKIITLKNAVGEYLINPYLIAEGAELKLLGKRVIFANDMPVVATNALPVIYGDFGMGYVVLDRLGIRVIRDIYTAKPYVKFYTTKFTGGAVSNFQSLKILKISA